MKRMAYSVLLWSVLKTFWGISVPLILPIMKLDTRLQPTPALELVSGFLALTKFVLVFYSSKNIFLLTV